MVQIKKIKIITYLIIAIVLIVAIFPYFWLILTSFKAHHDVLSINQLQLFKPTLNNYVVAFIEKNFGSYVLNSLIIAFGSSALVIAVGTPAAYSLSRFKVFGGNHLFLYFLATRMCPPIVIALPLYIMFSKLMLLDTHIGLILAHTAFNLGLAVWIMRAFFADVPKELEERALVDGCSHFNVFRRIALPIVAPGILATTIICVIFSWNEFVIALTLTSSNAATLPVKIPGLVTHVGTMWAQVAAVTVIATIPIIVLAYFIQRYILMGLTFGAVRG